MLKSLLKPFDFKSPVAQPARPEAALSSGLFNALGYLLWAAFAGTLILFVIRILKIKATNLPLSVVPSPKPDLAEEEIEANQLPDNEWYALAREKMAAGEFRQAQRALFLAILSYLASHRLITVQRWKSNTDYEMELGPQGQTSLRTASALRAEPPRVRTLLVRCGHRDTRRLRSLPRRFTNGSKMRPPEIVAPGRLGRFDRWFLRPAILRMANLQMAPGDR